MAITEALTTLGKVRGLARPDADITEFRGIPYALPPVGERRFAPPAPAEPWEGVRLCDSFPKAPPQHFFDPRTELYPLGLPETGEDCLYLNIWTPAKSAGERLPVYLWYHDGGLTNGWAYDPRNDFTELTKQGIVVVSVGMRLGEFGHLALPQLTAERGASGDYGILDDLLALQWVHENVAAFGGDPANVTLAGESGGTFKCGALVAIPAAKGLFRRVISQSGLAWLYDTFTLEEAERFGRDFLTRLGLDPDLSADELRALPTEAFRGRDIGPYDQPGKLIENEALYGGPFREAFLRGAEGVDFLNCVCSGDARIGRADLDENGRFSSTASYYAYVRSFLGDLYDAWDFERLVPVTDENAHRTAVLLSSLGLSPKIKSSFCRSIMVDRLFSRVMAREHPESRVWTLRFSQVQPNRTDIPALPDVAAPHGSDLWYSNMTLLKGWPVSRPWREEDRTVARWMNTQLGNFVRTGDPNGPGLPAWPRGGESLGWLDLSITPQAHTGLENKLDELIYEHTVRLYGL